MRSKCRLALQRDGEQGGDDGGDDHPADPAHVAEHVGRGRTHPPRLIGEQLRHRRHRGRADG